MYFNNAEWFLSKIFPGLTWSRETGEKKIYLTFDDGPIPVITEWVLELLEQYKVKATFFVVGDNVGKYPDVIRKVHEAGHKIGNHTFNHLNGWKNSTDYYIENTEKCKECLTSTLPDTKSLYSSGGKMLFRPPYGKASIAQRKKLYPQYEIVMWNVLTGDFDKNLHEDKCLHKAIKYTSPGAIVIFHDSLKAERNLRYVLPRYIEHFLQQGYQFDTL